jgi:hypothetical protein
LFGGANVKVAEEETNFVCLINGLKVNKNCPPEKQSEIIPWIDTETNFPLSLN